jgi:hypothetical protein
LHPYRIGPDYLRLPGVERFEDDGSLYFPGVSFSNVCVAIDGTAYDYFLSEAYGPTWYFRVPYEGATPLAFGSGGSSATAWQARFEQCERDLYKAAYP